MSLCAHCQVVPLDHMKTVTMCVNFVPQGAMLVVYLLLQFIVPAALLGI